MLHLHYQQLTQWLHSHPDWGGAAAFIVAFAESVAVIGTIVPGTVTMTAVGILIGSGAVPTLTTLLLAIAGAVCGDALSYHVGFAYKEKIPHLWPFYKHPHWLNNAKQFFYKHGGKGIIIGRFVGPIRAFIPIIAGILSLPAWRFYPVDIIAATCWAIVYLLPGYIIGVAAANLPADIAGKLVMMLLLILVGFWFIIWLLKLSWQFFGRQLDRLSQYCWQQWIIKNRHTAWLYFLLRDATRPRDHGQLILIWWTLFSLIAFIALAALSISSWWGVIHLDLWMHHFLRSLRTPHSDVFFAIISSFNNLTLLSILTIATLAIMAYDKHYMAIMYWVLALGLITLVVYSLKLSHYITYPHDIAQPNLGLSAFPSMTLALSASVYGFITWFVCFNRPLWKRYVYPALACWLVLLVISQIYLGLNWLSAALAGILIAISITTIAAISYQRHERSAPNNLRFAVVLGPLWLILLIIAALNSWQDILQSSTPIWPQHQLQTQKWWHQQSPFTPTYRRNRLDYPSELLNVEWMGSLTNIHQHLQKAGWQDWHIGFSQDTLKQIADDKTLRHVHLFAEMYSDQSPLLRMSRKTLNGQLVLRLWDPHIKLLPQKQPLWVGTIKQRSHKAHKLSPHKAYHGLIAMSHSYQIRIHHFADKQVPDSLKTTNHPPYAILLKPKASSGD